MPTTSTTAADFDTAQTEIAQALRHLLADVFALYLKTKGFHWHVGGRHFREDHLFLDEQANQIFQMVDDIAERIRKIGGSALRSIADVARHQRLNDSANEGLSAVEMFAVARRQSSAHQLISPHPRTLRSTSRCCHGQPD